MTGPIGDLVPLNSLVLNTATGGSNMTLQGAVTVDTLLTDLRTSNVVTDTFNGLVTAGGFAANGAKLTFNAGAVFSGGASFSTGTLTTGGTLTFAAGSSFNGTFANPILIGAATTIDTSAINVLLIFNGTINTLGASPLPLTVNAGTGGLTFNGRIGGTSALGTLTANAGTITLANTATLNDSSQTTLTALTNIAINASGAALTNNGAGVLVLQADAGGGDSGTLTFGSGGTIAWPGGVQIDHHPAAYPTATNFAGSVTSGTVTAYMEVDTVADLQNIAQNSRRQLRHQRVPRRVPFRQLHTHRLAGDAIHRRRRAEPDARRRHHQHHRYFGPAECRAVRRDRQRRHAAASDPGEQHGDRHRPRQGRRHRRDERWRAESRLASSPAR